MRHFSKIRTNQPNQTKPIKPESFTTNETVAHCYKCNCGLTANDLYYNAVKKDNDHISCYQCFEDLVTKAGKTKNLEEELDDILKEFNIGIIDKHENFISVAQLFQKYCEQTKRTMSEPEKKSLFAFVVYDAHTKKIMYGTEGMLIREKR